VFSLLSSANAVFVSKYLMLWYPSNLLPCFTSIVLLNTDLLYSPFKIADFSQIGDDQQTCFLGRKDKKCIDILVVGLVASVGQSILLCP